MTTVVAHTPTGHGRLDLHADGSFSYTADAGFTGTDTIQYTTTELPAATTTTTVSILVGH